MRFGSYRVYGSFLLKIHKRSQIGDSILRTRNHLTRVSLVNGDVTFVFRIDGADAASLAQ